MSAHEGELLFGRCRPINAAPTRSNNAEIWKVEDTLGELHGPLALKVLTRVDRRERFEQEILALEDLSRREPRHPNIIQLLSHSIPPADSEDRAHLVVPWLAGG